MSLEYIENIIDIKLNFDFKKYENIYESKINSDDKKNLPVLFNYIIKNNSFGLYLKFNNKIIWYKNCLISPIITKNKAIKLIEIYNILYN